MSTRKRITELTVAELQTQLSKRGVEATGDKPALIAKLKKVGYVIDKYGHASFLSIRVLCSHWKSL